MDYFYNRTKKCYRVLSKRKRTTIPPETYNTKECCYPMLVFGDLLDTASWKNDVTSVWFKLSGDTTDYVDFILYDDKDVQTSYQPSKKNLPHNDGNYATIYWRDLLQAEASGCYYIKVKYMLDGTEGEFIWGEYKLQKYSTEATSGTIRIKSKINQYYSIDDIDFTDTNIIDCIRVNGFFGEMKPNFKIDNLIYENRKFENVQRERIATYTMKTDPILYKFSEPLINVHLLAENTIWLSDYNSFNHSWFYKDIELIVSNSPEIEYVEQSRLAKVTCEFTDKTRDNLAKYV